MSDTFRRTGRTTKLIQEAPMYSIFVWCNSDLHIPKKIAKELGREDLRIESLSFITLGRLRGMETPITLDHHTFRTMTEAQWDEYDNYCCWRDMKANGVLNSMGIVTL